MLRFIYDKNERNYSLINSFMSQRVVADEVYQLMHYQTLPKGT